MKTLSKVLGLAFGYLCMGLTALVCFEVFARKTLAMSVQGADELGGYVLAIGSCLCFCVALIGRNHMRIDVLHYLFPPKVQAILNWISIVTLTLFALLLAATGFRVVIDTYGYQSTAPTPWQTPLIYPQSLWYAAIVMFALIGIYLTCRATLFLATNRWEELRVDFQPKATKEELKEELDDAAKR